MELFSDESSDRGPLAARMRPRTLDEYIGQDHIVGKGRLLRRAIAADRLTSVIFYGPPGSGKTTLARVIANHTKSNFITLNAVLTGVADIRKAIDNAETSRRLYGKKTILFVDEVHRWNKSQQDALLPWVENGTIILIGATTENPFFEVNKALVSRSRVFQLKALTQEDLEKTAEQALNDSERGYGHYKVVFEEGALQHLVETANGDARSLLNALELAVETTPKEWNPTANPPLPPWGSTIYISKETAEESIQKKVVLYDRDGDYHYDIISAFIKSLRGRDPDAACYWLARMVKAGEDPSFIFRRMLISACEDTGLADPQAISVVQNCAAAFDRVGLPEGRYFLAHAALYLATAPKSNSSMAFFDALASVEKEDADVPNHLKDASRDAEGFGHGAGYLYPHAYRDHWVAQQYLPDSLAGKVFYTPSKQGYEAKIREEVLSRREIQIASILGKKNEAEETLAENPISSWWQKSGHLHGFEKKDENLTFSPKDNRRETALDRAEKSWQARLESGKSQVLTLIRDTMEEAAGLLRHHRCLVWGADDALLLFDIMRKTPEGLTCGACRSKEGMDTLYRYSATLGDLDKPLLSMISPAGREYFSNGALRKTCESFSQLAFGPVLFDRLFFRDPFAYSKDIFAAATSLAELWNGSKKTKRNISFGSEEENTDIEKIGSEPLLAREAKVIFSQRIPSGAQHLSSLIEEKDNLIAELDKAESAFFSDTRNPLFSWTEKDIESQFEKQGLVVKIKSAVLTEKRHLSLEEIEKWFDSEKSSYGTFIKNQLGQEKTERIKEILKDLSKSKALFDWKTKNAFVCVTKAY